jgi:hypothetical protein
VFEGIADRDGVSIVAWLPGEPLVWFLTRLARGCTLLERNGLCIRSAIMACSGKPDSGSDGREMVVRGLANRLSQEHESHVVLVGDGMAGAAPASLVPLVDALMNGTGTTAVSVDVLAQPGPAWRASFSDRPAPRSRIHPGRRKDTASKIPVTA